MCLQNTGCSGFQESDMDVKLKAFWGAYTWEVYNWGGVVPNCRRNPHNRLIIWCVMFVQFLFSTHLINSLLETNDSSGLVSEVRGVQVQTQHTMTNLEQFLAAISNRKVSGPSYPASSSRHIEFKGPNEDGAVIHFETGHSSNINDGKMGFV